MAAEKEQIQLEKNHYLITPSDPVQRAICEKVEKACRNFMLQEYKIRVNGAYLTTFACVYLESIVKTLAKVMRETGEVDEDVSINFLDLFTVTAGNRDAENADKDGNINIAFTPGLTVANIMERDFVPQIEPSMWQGTILNEVEKTCTEILSRKHKAVGNSNSLWTLIAYVYFDYLFRTLKLMARGAKEEGKNAVSINFLEMMELHCTLDVVQINPDDANIVSEKFTVKIRPGFESKLLIKNDGTTEQNSGL